MNWPIPTTDQRIEWAQKAINEALERYDGSITGRNHDRMVIKSERLARSMTLDALHLSGEWVDRLGLGGLDCGMTLGKGDERVISVYYCGPCIGRWERVPKVRDWEGTGMVRPAGWVYRSY